MENIHTNTVVQEKLIRRKCKNVKTFMFNRNALGQAAIMLPADETTLLSIEEDKGVSFNINNVEFDKSNIIGYGKVDWKNKTFRNIVEKLSTRGDAVIMPSDYNYKNHDCNGKITECSNWLHYAKYGHGCIGKPKYIIMVKMNIKLYGIYQRKNYTKVSIS